MGKLISYIVPIYNVGKYINNCIDSIIEQDSNQFEVILVDDGSTDECLYICDKYKKKDRRIKVIHTKNNGLVSARKEGLKIAAGEYISCVDGDDWIEKNHFSVIEKVINENHPDVICYNYNVFGGTNKLNDYFKDEHYDRKKIEKEIFPCLIQSENATYFSPVLWNKVIKRDIYERAQLNVDGEIKIGEDSACTLPCIYLANTIVTLSKKLYNYRKTDVGMTYGHKVFDMECPKRITNCIFRIIDIDSFDFKQQSYRKTVHELFATVITQFYRKEKYQIVKNEIIKEIDNNCIYKNAINKAKFKHRFSALIMKYTLKYKLLFIIKVWSMIK